ncbi:hypothetical protein [Flavobacterium sp. J27]|uniref:hypothetical protein n=1 Tax=Flavobacterium sp. J27 TaxID=2060419 RepID=UPI0010326B55|nr:hypothetical protein [Flavobacterium sp. J27]
MKTTIYFLMFGVFFSFLGYGQNWGLNTSQGAVYTTTQRLLIGANQSNSTLNSNDGSIELFSPSYSAFFMNAADKHLVYWLSQEDSGMRIDDHGPFKIYKDGVGFVMNFNNDGSISVGTALAPSGYKLAVGGKIIAEELKVQLQSAPWPDYVFANDYSLPTLQEVELHIQENGHLANMPSACEVQENGIEVGEMNRLLLEKVEQLTLYTINQQKQLDNQTKEIETLKALVKELVENK